MALNLSRIKQLAEFDEKKAFEFFVADDLHRFNGKFPSESVELIAKIVATSKVEGSKQENSRLQPLIHLLADQLAVAVGLLERYSQGIKNEVAATESARQALASIEKELGAVK